MIKTKTENLMKMGVIALLATTLAISDSASAINLTIGNTSSNSGFLPIGSDRVGQSFTNDPTNVTGASILLNNWTFGVYENSGSPSFSLVPLFRPTTLNIYAGTGLGSTPIGSSSTYTTAGSTFSDATATWTFAGGLSLIDNQPYTAVLDRSGINFRASNANPYADGILTKSTSGNLTGSDTVFTANFSSAPTAVPFEFEPTGGFLVLGGGWLLRRHLKKRATKVK